MRNLSLEQICFEDKYREADREVMEAWFFSNDRRIQSRHLFSSFETQLRVYEGKLARAEADLKGGEGMVVRSRKSPYFSRRDMKTSLASAAMEGISRSGMMTSQFSILNEWC